jgi:hypothetical protein
VKWQRFDEFAEGGGLGAPPGVGLKGAGSGRGVVRRSPQHHQSQSQIALGGGEDPTNSLGDDWECLGALPGVVLKMDPCAWKGSFGGYRRE